MPSAWNLDKAKRNTLRKAIEEGEHVPRVKKDVAEERYPPLTETELNTMTNRLDHVIRWNSFLTHTAINAHDQIDSVSKGTLDRDSADFGKLRQKVLENTRSYKNKTLGNFEVSISSTTRRNAKCLTLSLRQWLNS